MNEKEEKNDPVTQALFDYRMPKRAGFDSQTGAATRGPLNDYVWNSFVLACASAFGEINYSGNHILTHYYDVGVELGYRDESKTYLEQTEMVPGFLHDVPEDIGSKMPKEMLKRASYSFPAKFSIWASQSKNALRDGAYSLPYAYVLIDVIDDLLSEDIRLSGDAHIIDLEAILSLLTNKGDLLFDPVKSYFQSKSERGLPLAVDINQLVERMDRYYDELPLSNSLIKDFYGGIIRRWEHFVDRVLPVRCINLPKEDYRSIEETVQNFISKTRQRLKQGGILEARMLEERVAEDYAAARILMLGPLEEIRTSFMHPLESKTILDVRKTLYRAYVRNIMDAVRKDAKDHHGSPALPYGDFYLLPAMVKLPDSRDVVTRLGPTMLHIRSMFRKVRIVLEESFATVGYLKENGYSFQRLENAAYFLLDSLTATLSIELKKVADEREIQTQHTRQLEELKLMMGLVLRFRADLHLPEELR